LTVPLALMVWLVRMAQPVQPEVRELQEMPGLKD
jgi:hypothetical protein